MFIPTAFSPNSDGENDHFTVYGSDVTLINTLEIYDRWGNLLHRVEDLAPGVEDTGWNGSAMGQMLPIGVYLYHVELTFRNDLQASFAGSVALLK